MKNYLIDFENVQDSGLGKLQNKTTAEDHIYILFTANANKVSMNTLSCLSGELHFVSVPAGKESLDRHLLTLLGFLLHKDGKDCDNIIFSNDTGFDCVLDFWAKQGYHISRLASNTAKSVPTPAEQPPKSGAVSENTILNAKLMNVLKASDIPNAQKGELTSYVIKNKANKHAVYCWMVKTFGQKTGLKTYKLIAEVL